MYRRKTVGAAAALLLGSVALTGCADSNADDVSGSNLKGDPILIGYLVPDGGPEANPQVDPGLDAGLKYVNGEYGGINGRPLKVLKCHTDATPAKETSCANDFVNKGVVAVLDGFDRGIEFSLPVYKEAKIPVIGNVAQNAVADTDTTGAYIALGPANAVYAIGPLVAFQQAGLDNVAFGLNDIPAQHTYADKFLVPVAKALGIKLNAIYYDDASPNFSVVAATAKSSGADLLGVVKLANPTQCKQFIDQSRQAGYEGELLAGNCVGIEQLGNSKGVYAYSNDYFPAMKAHAPEAVQKDLDVTEKVMKDIPDDQKGFFTYEDFSTLMDFVRVTATIKGTVNAPAITKAFTTLKDYQGFAGGKLTCGGTAFPGTSACSNQLLLSKSLGDGTLQPSGSDADGGFVSVDPSLVPAS